NQNNSQVKMTTLETNLHHGTDCPGQDILKLLSGKWKPQIMRLASKDKLRFNTLLRQLPGSNKQTLTVALRELEEARVLLRTVVKEKPLHIEYTLTERGKSMIDVYRVAAAIAKKSEGIRE
ncbi:MAG TPA: helix-turn-helix domain-containing protein, partial [Cyclobacteriaceae bacterium]|nr:helix-turn-helix domain-containing protein [Cyclobacteriaceae bacterium]